MDLENTVQRALTSRLAAQTILTNPSVFRSALKHRMVLRIVDTKEGNIITVNQKKEQGENQKRECCKKEELEMKRIATTQ